jgi:hypothetical protein
VALSSGEHQSVPGHWYSGSSELLCTSVVSRYSQPFSSARRAASTRLRAPSFLIAVESVLGHGLLRCLNGVRHSTKALAMAFWPAREGCTPSGP